MEEGVEAVAESAALGAIQERTPAPQPAPARVSPNAHPHPAPSPPTTSKRPIAAHASSSDTRGKRLKRETNGHRAHAAFMERPSATGIDAEQKSILQSLILRSRRDEI